MESNRATEAGREQVPDYVLSKESFLELLAHERACSERSGSPFAVLVFQVDGQSIGEEQIVGAIVSRVRATDALGWLDDGRLGVLLRYTTVTDALRVAQQVRKRAGASEGDATCTVHGFPPFHRGASQAPELAPDLARGLPHALGSSEAN